MRGKIVICSFIFLCLNAYSIEYDFLGIVGSLEEKNLYDVRVGFDSNVQNESVISMDEDSFKNSIEILINNTKISANDYILKFEDYSNITTSYYNQEDPRKGFVITIRNVSILDGFDYHLKVFGDLKYTSLRKERHLSNKPLSKLKLWDDFIIGGMSMMLIKKSKNEFVFKIDTDKHIELFFNIGSGSKQPKVGYRREWGAVNGEGAKMHNFLTIRSGADLNRIAEWGVVNDSLPIVNNMTIESEIKL